MKIRSACPASRIASACSAVVMRPTAAVGTPASLRTRSAKGTFQRWQFEPGRKNGAPVALEVVVEIPFRLSRLF